MGDFILNLVYKNNKNIALKIDLVSVAISLFGLYFLTHFLLLIFYKSKWGIIYASKNGEIIKNALIEIFDQNGVLVKKTSSNKNGRYGFRIKSGQYFMKVTKNSFVFPAKTNINSGLRIKDHNYFGHKFYVKSWRKVVWNIPLD